MATNSGTCALQMADSVCIPPTENFETTDEALKKVLMKKRQIAGWIAFIGGCFVTIIGIQHFPMAYNMAGSQDFAALSKGASDFFIMLCLSVGILLLTFGILSMYFSRKIKLGDQAARFFFLCVGIMFLLRCVIELMHPVTVPAPNPSVLINLFIVSLLYLILVAIMGKGDADT